MRLLPVGESCLEALHPLFGEPYGASAIVRAAGGDLDEPGAFEHLQIARERRLVEANALSELIRAASPVAAI